MSAAARTRFEANEVLGFDSSIMFGGTDEALKQTAVTQPTVLLFRHPPECLGDTFNQAWLQVLAIQFSVAGCLNFAGACCVSAPANAMQKHVKPNHRPWRQCRLGQRRCGERVPRNPVLWLRQYNCGQLVISRGSSAVEAACTAQ